MRFLPDNPLISIRIATILSINQESVRYGRNSHPPRQAPLGIAPCQFGEDIRCWHPSARLHQRRRTRQTQGRVPAWHPPRRRPGPSRPQKHQLGNPWLHGRHPWTRRDCLVAPVLELASHRYLLGALLDHRLPGRDHRLSQAAEPSVLPGPPLAGAVFRHLWRDQLPARAPRLGGPAPPSPQVFRYGC